MPYSTANGCKIYYEVSGEGPALLLIHANPFDHRLWMYQAAHLSSFFTVVCVDIRGYGRSAKIESPFSLEDLARDALGVCSDLGIRSAIVGGCSVGSGVALLIGQRYSEFARALILVGGSSKGGSNIMTLVSRYIGPEFPKHRHDHLTQCFAPGFSDTVRGAWIVRMFDDTTPTLSGRSISRNMEARVACDMSGGLADMRLPVLVINGEHDNSLPRGRLTAAGIPAARHVTIPGAGHACSIENPEAFDSAVIEFLQDNELWPPLAIA
jgi:pimeloyl-ACP methyl ester carboxylesterase